MRTVQLLTLVLVAVLVLGALWSLGRAVRLRLLVTRLRRHGEQLVAEVVDTDVSAPHWNGGRQVRPVVRFRVDGRERRAPVLNCSTPKELGSGLRIATGPDLDSDVVCLDDDNSGTGLFVTGGFLVVAVGLAAWLSDLWL